MAKIYEEAMNYKPAETKNIAELDRVPVDIDIKDFYGSKDDGTPFHYKFIEVDGEQYRVPVVVLKQLKAHLTANPEINFFRVSKIGEGLKTEYTLIPLSN